MPRAGRPRAGGLSAGGLMAGGLMIDGLLDGGPRDSTVVAGLDVDLRRERDADGLAFALGRRLADAGHQTLIATHAVRNDRRTTRSVALSVAFPTRRRAGAVADEVEARAWLQQALAHLGLGDDQRAVQLGESVSGPNDLRPGAASALAERSSVSGGRAVYFTGVEGLVGTVLVADVLAHTPVQRVRSLGGSDVAASRRLVTRDFVRPRWSEGQLVLHVQPAAGGMLVPFESPNPTPCCANH